jgi:hypothetical protein
MTGLGSLLQQHTHWGLQTGKLEANYHVDSLAEGLTTCKRNEVLPRFFLATVVVVVVVVVLRRRTTDRHAHMFPSLCAYCPGLGASLF